MEDLATLGIAVDARQVDDAGQSLDRLTDKGGKAENQVKKLIDQSMKLANADNVLAGATDEVANRVERLRGSLDPVYAAQSRLNKEIQEAAALYKAGAIGAAEYAAAQNVLRERMDKVTALHNKAGAATKLHAHEMLNLSRQSADVAVSLAMGMNPLMVMIQQGPQIAETFGAASARGLGFTAVLRQMAAAGWAAVAPFAPLIAGAVALAAVVGGGFAIATSEANKEVGDLTTQLGLSEKQLDRLKDSGEATAITFGDTFGATMEVAGDRLYNAFKGPIDAVTGFFGDLWNNIVSGLDWTVGAIVGGFFAGINAVKILWRSLPAAAIDAAVSAANGAIAAIEWLVNKAREKVNIVIRGANAVADAVGLGAVLQEFDPVSIQRLNNPAQGAMQELGAAMGEGLVSGFSRGRQSWESFKSDVTAEARSRAVDRILEAAGEADPARASRARRSDAEREAERRIKQAEDFIKALEKETATLGMNAIQKKQWEIENEAVIAQSSGLDELAASIRRVGAALIERMRAEQISDLVEPLEQEAEALALQASLVNATTREREIEMAVLRARQELVAEGIDLESEGAQRILNLTRENAEAQADLNDNVGSTLKRLKEVATLSRDVASDIRDAASGMADAFGSVGKSLGDIVSIYADLIANNEQYAASIEEARLAGNTQEQMRLTERMRRGEVAAYGDMLSAAKGFFAEKSAGYKVLEAAERAYRLFEFAMSAQSIVVKATETAAKLPQYAAQAAAAAMAGAAEMFAQLGPWGFAAVAAMGVTLAAFGFRGGGGSAATLPTAQSRQDSQGRGSVLGDASAQSESIANALAFAEQYQNKDLDYSNAMVKSLKAIQSDIGALAVAVVRSLSAGGALDTSGLNLGTSGRAATLSNLGFGKNTTRTLNDQGLDLGSQTVGSILAGGVTGNTYQEIIENTVKKAFGITYSNKTRNTTVTAALDSDLSGEIGDVIKSMRASIIEAAKALGLEGAEATIDAFQVNIGKISFKDMTGAEIQEALTAVFGKVGDDMAKAVGEGLVERFQEIGEGALETLVRLATTANTFDQQMTILGKTLNLTGTAAIIAKQELVDMVGGLDSFVELTNSYAENFLTEAERLAPVQKAVADEMARLGYAGVTTKDQFKALVNGLDLSTESGAALFAALMNVAPAFAKVADAYQEAIDGASENVEDARDNLRQAYQREASALQQVIDRFKQFSASLREFRQQLTGGLAGLSPEQSYLNAKSIFEETAAKARNGDVDAIARLTQVGQNFVQASRDYYGSSQGFQRDLDAVTQAVDAAISVSDAQAATAEKQLEELKKSVELLIELNESVLSVADAIKELAAAQAALAAAQQAAIDDANRRAAEAKLENQPLVNGGPGDGFTGSFQLDPVAPVVIANDNRPSVGTGGGTGLYDYSGRYAGGGGLVTSDHVQLYAYAAGGIINRPMTVGEAGIAGESGTEAIMPLANVNGRLGVVAAAGNDNELKGVLTQIRDELEKANKQRGAGVTANLDKLTELVERFEEVKRELARA